MKYKKGDFILVANKRSIKGLDPNKQVIIMWLCEHSDDTMQSFPSRKTLANECGVSVRTLDRHLNDLVELGLLVKTARYNDNEQTSNVYEVVLRSVKRGDKSARGSDKSALGGDKNITQNSPHLTNPIDNTIVLAKPYGKPEINDLFNYWESQTGYKIQSRVTANRRACNNLLKKHGLDVTKGLINGAALSQADKYAPTISDFCSLQQKTNDLIVWGKKKSVNSTKGVEL